MLHYMAFEDYFSTLVTNLKSFVTDYYRIRMKLTSYSFPYKHIVNLYDNNPLLTSMIRTYVLSTGNTRRERNLRLTENYERR